MLALLLGQLLLYNSGGGESTYRLLATVAIIAASIGTLGFGLGLIAWDVYRAAVSAQLAVRMQRALHRLEAKDRRKKRRLRAQTSVFNIGMLQFSSEEADGDAGGTGFDRGVAREDFKHPYRDTDKRNGEGGGEDGDGDDEDMDGDGSWILVIASCIRWFHD